MLVSVIIPAYNRANTIKRAIESVLLQTWKELEVIVVDDGSMDGTAEIVSGYGEKVHLIRQNNQGPSAARNAGIRASQGEIISFLDSDDSWMPTKTERQVQLFQRDVDARVGCCVSNAKMVYASGRTVTSFGVADLNPPLNEGVWNNPTEILLTRFFLFNQAVAIRREVLERTGLFRSDMRIMEDYEFALRLSLTGPWAFVAEPLVTWFGGAENSLSQVAKELDVSRIIYKILDEMSRAYLSNPRLSPTLLRTRLRSLQQHIRAIEMSQKSNRANQFIGKCLMRSLRIRQKIGHWLPSFPCMKIEPLPPPMNFATSSHDKPV